MLCLSSGGSQGYAPGQKNYVSDKGGSEAEDWIRNIRANRNVIRCEVKFYLAAP